LPAYKFYNIEPKNKKMKKMNLKIIAAFIVAAACSCALVSCTTLEEKKRMLDQQFKAINKKDGISKDEAMIIARHYITIKTDLGQWNKLSNEVIDDNEHWLINILTDDRITDLLYERGSNSPMTDIQLLIDKNSGLALRVDKLKGEAAKREKEYLRMLEAQYIKMKGAKLDDNKVLKQRYKSINKNDGIDRDEAMIIATHYIKVKTDLGRWNRLSTVVKDDDEDWSINLISIRKPKKELFDRKILVNKTSGLALSQDIPLGEEAKKQKELVRRLEEQYEKMTGKEH
jgi:hypothetical protein